MLRQYHPSALEKPLNQRFFAYKVFFRRTWHGKNEKCGVTAANTNFRVYRQTGLLHHCGSFFIKKLKKRRNGGKITVIQRIKAGDGNGNEEMAYRRA